MRKSPFFSHRLVITLFILFIVAASIEIVLIAKKFEASAADRAFYDQTNVYFDQFYIPSNPANATSLGLHAYDDQLIDMSKEAIDTRIAELKQYEKIFAEIDPIDLSAVAIDDRDIVLNQIRSQLLTLETIQPWSKDPDIYSGMITNSAFVIMSRNFAPAERRLAKLIAREKLMPQLLLQARQNLKNPPKIYTQIALEQLPGMISFFQNDVPEAFKELKNTSQYDEFITTNNNVIKSLQEYQAWLKNDVLPNASGDFRLGEETYRKKLLYDEMVSTPLNELLAMNAADMKKNQEAFVRVAKQIAPDKTPEQVFTDLESEHPSRDKLLSTFAGEFSDLIRFIKHKKIITIPSDIRPIMEETPPFARAITFASMDTPGPYETNATEAFFNVTLPDPQWDAVKTNEFMSQFNNAAISSVAVHETYPGHYVQFLWMHKVHGKVRKILYANTNAEGWAHYCEQMILDEGFGKHGYGGHSDQDAAKLRLGQLQEALLRNARFTVGIKLHTGKMTFDEAIDYFVKEGKQSRHVGLVETKRATSDPTYLYYTLGKLQILALRTEIKKLKGRSFRLKEFHDDFMKQGSPPIKIVRRALLRQYHQKAPANTYPSSP